MIALTHDEVLKNIPFALICETREGARWNTGTRKRRWKEEFSQYDRDVCTRLFRKAKDWTLIHGVPDLVRMDEETYTLWRKLGDFCGSL